jgi:DNA-binding LacI/PurR family transcriptional regulator
MTRATTEHDGRDGTVTMATIAKTLGVSRTTVSNAYNRPNQLSPELRARILETAHVLGYSGPDPVASTLRRGRTGTIGLVFDEALPYAFTDPAQVLFLQGVADSCQQEGSGLLLVPAAGPGAGRDVILASLVDGFVVLGLPADDRRIEAVTDRGLPFVIVEGAPIDGVPFVGIDNRGGAQAVAQHLLDLGHRRFGVVSLPLSPDGFEGPASIERQQSARYDITADRMGGYREALDAAGIAWTTVPVDVRINRFRSGLAAAARLLDRPEPPTALLCMSDELALGAMEEAMKRGLDVPGDVSVVGFDDTPSASRSHPALTTVRQPLAEKGAAAAHVLLHDGPDHPRRVDLPTQVVVRGSSGPPPGETERATRKG